MNTNPVPVKRSFKTVSVTEVFIWLGVLLLPIAVYFTLIDRLTSNQSLFLALTSGSVVMWIFRLVPDFVPGIGLILVATLLELVPQSVAFSGFYSQIFFLVLGVFVLAAVLAESGWLVRIEVHLANKGGRSLRRQALSILISAIMLTLVVPSPLGRTTMIKPLLDRFISSTDARHNSFFALLSVHSTTLLSTLFLTGNPLNFVLLSMLQEQTRARFNWLGWLQASSGLLLFCLLALLGWLWWQYRTVKADDSEAEALPTPVPQTLSLRDWGIAVLYGLMILGVFTQSWHQIPLSWLVLFLALTVFLFQGLNLATLRRSVDWPTLLFIASVVAWGGMLDELQLSDWLAAQVTLIAPIFEQNFYLGISVVMALVLSLRLVIPGAPAFILLAATLLPFANVLGVSPWLIGFIVLTVSEAFIFPYQHGVLSQLISDLEAQQKPFIMRRLIAGNLFFLLVRIAAIYLSIPWWQTIYLI
jgi:divalent anion:Na+ symporter, DASS family